jgi:hypothetical protein
MHVVLPKQPYTLRILCLGIRAILPFPKNWPTNKAKFLNYLHPSLILNITNSMEQSPSWEANSQSASEATCSLTSNPKVHYRVHKILSLVPILSQIHPVQTSPPYLSTIHSNIIFSSIPGSSVILKMDDKSRRWCQRAKVPLPFKPYQW